MLVNINLTLKSNKTSQMIDSKKHGPSNRHKCVLIQGKFDMFFNIIVVIFSLDVASTQWPSN